MSRKAGLARVILIITLAMFASRATADGQFAQYSETIVNYFNAEAFLPVGDLVSDASGNLYGVTMFTYAGSDFPLSGAVFELSKAPGGGWQITYLHWFSDVGDGSFPDAGLVMDASGNLYGTTYQGGAYGYGTVYELSPIQGGGWNEALLYSFTGGSDGSGPGGSFLTNAAGNGGSGPNGSLIFDAKGNLYGVTYAGGSSGAGVVFELSPNTQGQWTETVLYAFTGDADGASPVGRLVFDAAGNLYGATQSGGIINSDSGIPGGFGVIYELSPSSAGPWTETVLHAFDPSKTGEYSPNGSLIFDAAGNLYGTTLFSGTAFELSPGSGGQWVEAPIYVFSNEPLPSCPYPSSVPYPMSDLIFDKNGSLYGTTSNGGSGCTGTVYKLSPNSTGLWTETILHYFSGGIDGGDVNVSSTDGGDSVSGVLIDAQGNLFGMTQYGGHGDCSFDGQYCGTVYELQPRSLRSRPLWRVLSSSGEPATEETRNATTRPDPLVPQPSHSILTR